MPLNMGRVQINRHIHTERLCLHLQPHLKMGYTPIFAFVFAFVTLSVNGPLLAKFSPPFDSFTTLQTFESDSDSKKIGFIAFL